MRRGVKSRRLPHFRSLSWQAHATGVEDPPGRISLVELGSGILRPVTWVCRKKAAATRDVGVNVVAPTARLAEQAEVGGVDIRPWSRLQRQRNPVATKALGLIVWKGPLVQVAALCTRM
ncbi:hypothetical protein MRX96_030862 [Rhipicephalus microplus]